MTPFVTFLAAFAMVIATSTASKGIRGPETRKLNEDGCTFRITHHFQKHNNELDKVEHTEPIYECSIGGLSHPFVLDEEQKQILGLMVKNGEAISGVSKYQNVKALKTTDGLVIPRGEPIIFDNFSTSNNQKPVVHVGTTYWLGVKVIDKTGLATANSTHVMSDKMFGTYGEEITLTSQIEDCSAGKLKVVSALPPTATEEEANSIRANTVDKGHPMGFMEVTIDMDIKSGVKWSDVRNAAKIAANEMLGFDLPGPFDHVAFIVEGCYKPNGSGRGCGWAAEAGVNTWDMFYLGYTFRSVGIVVHEYGHNLGMAHSRGLNGYEYSDHTCALGNPVVPKMCYNPAKNYYLNTKGWYEGGVELYDPAVQDSWTGTLMGVGEWKDYPAAYPMVVKIETGTEEDYYVGFNRAAGANADNDEADDLVTIVKTGTNGEGYDLSDLQGYIGSGEYYTIPNWQGNDWDLVISVGTINLDSNPGTAVVTISHNGDVAPVASPTSPPVTTPTESPIPPPTPPPIAPPTSCTVCTDDETPAMVKKGIDCAETDLVDKKCNKSSKWASRNICQLSCFNSGNGYEGDNCCLPDAPTTPPVVPTTPPVVPSPTTSCIQCSNEESPTMVSSGKDCETSSNIDRKCDFNNWKKNKFCQLECYLLGKGYDGDICCTSN